MSPREKFEISYDTLIAQVKWLEHHMQVVFEGLGHIYHNSEDAHMLGEFLQRQLVEYQGRLLTIKNHAEALKNAADPNAPEDLPF